MKATLETGVTAAAGEDTGKLATGMARISTNSARTRAHGSAKTASVAIAGLAAAAVLAIGCAKATLTPPPVVAQTAPNRCDDSPGFCVIPTASGKYEINSLVTCSYANGVFSACALDSGATLDDFVNSVTTGVGVNQ